MKYFLLSITLFLLPVTQSLAQNKKEVRLDPRYTQALLFNDSLMPLKEMVDGRPVWSIMNLKTTKITPLQVDTLLYFKRIFRWGDKIIAAKNGKWGIVSTDGKIILPFEYNFIEHYDWFPWFVKKDGLWGLMDDKGQVVATPMYKRLGYTDSSFIMAILPNDEWGLIDFQGKVLVPYNSDQYTFQTSPDKNLVIIQNWEREIALFNIKLQEYVLPFERQQIEFQTFSLDQTTQLVKVRRSDAYGYGYAYGLGNADGQLTTPVHYDFINWAMNKSSNYATAKLTDSKTREIFFHFLDEKGAIVGITAPGYDWVDCIRDGLAAFRTKDWKYGFLNPDGTVAIPPIYTDFKPFQSGQALMTLPSYTCVLIDKKGQVVQTFGDCSDFRFDDTQQFASFRDHSGKYGLMDKNKKIIITPSTQFNYHFTMTNLTNEIIHIRTSNGKEGVMKTNGTMLFPLIFDKISWEPESRYFLLEKDRVHSSYSLDYEKYEKSPPLIMIDDKFDDSIPINVSKYGKSIMVSDSFALFMDNGQLVLMYLR